MSDALVREFYTQHVRDEWRRLFQDPYHALEFSTTTYFLEKYMPPCGSVLDAGGGPGRYTFELARKGYDVTLFDATQANLDFARRQVKRHHLQEHIKQIVNGSIVDMSMFPDATFDAVICTGGPLSHILDPQQRARAISELFRVGKPGAPVFASVIGRFNLLTVVLVYFQDEMELPYFEQALDTGDYFGGHGFTACHFFLPEELQEAFTFPRVTILEMAGLEGISTHHPRQLNQLAKNEARFKIWYETHLQTCTHPAVVGMSEHMLIICRKS